MFTKIKHMKKILLTFVFAMISIVFCHAQTSYGHGMDRYTYRADGANGMKHKDLPPAPKPKKALTTKERKKLKEEDEPNDVKGGIDNALGGGRNKKD